MRLHIKEAMEHLQTQMNSIVENTAELDYVAVLNFGANVSDIDVIVVDSKFRDPKRLLNQGNLLKTIGLERESYKVNPYDQDKMLNARDHLYRFTPVGLGEHVIIFACYNHGDVNTFREEAYNHREALIAGVRALMSKTR